MRIHVVLCLGVMLLPVAAGVSAVAQKFQEPSKEDLRMTSDPKAPGAAAVYLDLQESTDNYSHYISEYARIKVLTDAGKEYATVNVPYKPGDSEPPIIEGRTIHADGAVIPLTGKAADLLEYKTKNGQSKVAVFNLPSVEVGSILEYKWTIPLSEGHTLPGQWADLDPAIAASFASSTPEWQVQRDIYAHHEHFYFNPFTALETASNLGGQTSVDYFVDGERAHNLLYTARLPVGGQVQKSQKNDYTLDLKDVPAVAHESNTPPMQGLSYRVHFYWSPYYSGDSYWDFEGKRWSKRRDHLAEQTGTIKSAATTIVAGADTDEAKARKLYDAVQALENTSFTRDQAKAEMARQRRRKEELSAQDVWNSKSGSDSELASLYLALVRAAGLQADAMSVADRNSRLFDPNFLALYQLEATVVVLHLNGKDVFTDPGAKFCPFGQLSWNHSLSGGLRQTATGASHDSSTPANLSKDAISAHSADLMVDAQGAVTGTVKIMLFGPEALRWRQLNATNDTADVEKQFNASLPEILPQGITGQLDHLQGLDTPATALVANVNVHGSLGSVTGKRLLMPAFFFSANAHPLFVSEDKRALPVDLHYNEQEIDDVTYHLPAGYTVETAPPASQLPWPDHAALVVKVTPGTNTVNVKRIFARAFVFLAPADYPALRTFYQKVAANDAQQLVLSAGGA